MQNNLSNFRQRLIDGELIVGIFQKTPSMMIAEVLADTDIDVVCIDAEHSPFDRKDIDASLLAYRSADKPALVRVPSASPEHILNALDCGATGIVVPHVYSSAKAHAVAKASQYGERGRGYAGSTRAAEYASRNVEQNIAASASCAVIAQIEDLTALNEIDEIASISGIDCLFIGMMDLTVALGLSSPKEPAVVDAAKKICAAANKANRRLGIFVTDPKDIRFWQEQGVSLFLLSSEHAFIKQGVSDLLTKINH